jgi:hypothetical protein
MNRWAVVLLVLVSLLCGALYAVILTAWMV